MDISDAELRDLVRAAVAARLSRPETPRAVAVHASHALLPLARGGDTDGLCLIEPSVRCNHCGYCLSFGH